MIFRISFFFILFVFYFVAQADVITYLLARIIGHPVKDFSFFSAFLLSSFFTVATYLLEKTKISRRLTSFSIYLLVTLLATILVNIPFSIERIGILIFIVLIFFFIEKKNKVFPPKSDSIWQKTTIQIIKLLVICLFLGLGAGATDIDHYELRTAQAVVSNNPQKIKKIGRLSHAVSPRLFAMRCFVIAKIEEKGLGEKLMEQPIPQGGSENLLFPNDEQQQCLLPIDSLYLLLGKAKLPQESLQNYLRSQAYANDTLNNNTKNFVPNPSVDYYLSALLLDKKLRLFAQEVQKLYPEAVRQGILPTCFAQALILYIRKHSNEKEVYHDATIEANYLDYTAMADTLPDNRERCNLLRHNYGTTYWWWYDYSN